ncbi:electron transport complex protein RnfB [Nocardia transvalensis]|uniref:Electron transport complex protein RnfB n=1 Tax=Nocardia transvalensis TaxID=37333 RepID=A0A7W9PJP0_9NOCA|nr:4Fe-4S dicluster-binding protein [Nocardia transvalensis]MBB5917422.1 electron transport complex protein RnfB [Nocardia transvalensis]
MKNNEIGAGSTRHDRITTRGRNEAWRKPPRRIEASECITCDSCLRGCPPEFGAIFNRGLDVVIVPELCSGCPSCVLVCPVDCIYVDEDWESTGNDMWSLVAPAVEEY